MSFAAGQNLNSFPADSGPATQSLPSSPLTEDEEKGLAGFLWSDVQEHAKHNGILKCSMSIIFLPLQKLTEEQTLSPRLSAFHAQTK